MKHIVVGTDGSPGAHNAIRWAYRFASLHDAEVIVMTGFKPTDSELLPGRLETLVARQEQELASWSEAAEPGAVPVRTIVEHGDARPGILAVAEREQADLIVIGRVGRSAGPGLFRIGSMAEWLAHHVDRPVAVVSDGGSHTIHNVLVGVDGSAGSRAAVQWVRDLCTNSKVRVVAVSVGEPSVELTVDDDPEIWRRGLERRIREDYAADLVAAGVEFEALAVRGSNAADALLQTAQEQQADLVVVGARGLGGFTGLRIGGVALQTLHRTDRSIVLVPLG